MNNEEKYEYFIDICDTGSITRAAEKHYISQPAMSKYIANLETELGTRLINRKAGHLSITKAGEIYLNFAKETFENYKKMKSEVECISLSEPKTITFGISVNLSEYFLNDVIRLALEINPDFDFNIIENTSLNMEKMLENGKVDIAFLNTDSKEGKNVDYTIVQKDRIYIVCGKNNPFLSGKKKRFINGKNVYVFEKSEIENLPFYSRGKNFKLTETVNRYLSNKGINIKNILFVSDLYTLLNLAKSTNRFAFSPETYLDNNSLTDDMALCTIEGESIEWYAVFARLKNSHQPEQITQWFNKVKEFYT